MRLDRDQLLELAELVAAAIDARRAPAGVSRLVDAQELAALLDVSRAFVYEHALELGAVKIGQGARPRLRFDVDQARERLVACSRGRESTVPDAASERASRPRRRRGSGTAVDLLPIRGGRGLS